MFVNWGEVESITHTTITLCHFKQKRKTMNYLKEAGDQHLMYSSIEAPLMRET